jgi:hypothetical protein
VEDAGGGGAVVAGACSAGREGYPFRSCGGYDMVIGKERKKADGRSDALIEIKKKSSSC